MNVSLWSEDYVYEVNYQKLSSNLKLTHLPIYQHFDRRFLDFPYQFVVGKTKGHSVVNLCVAFTIYLHTTSPLYISSCGPDLETKPADLTGRFSFCFNIRHYS